MRAASHGHCDAEVVTCVPSLYEVSLVSLTRKVPKTGSPLSSSQAVGQHDRRHARMHVCAFVC
jgi:hypothetical protein